MGTDAGLATGIEWGVASQPLAGEIASGDLHLVTRTKSGILAAAIDGLGHGELAAKAARTVRQELKDHADEFLISLVHRAHAVSKMTRGVAMSLASLDTSSGIMSWLGVGNVEGIVVRADVTAVPLRERLVIRNGVVGYSMPSLRAFSLRLTPGDVLMFVTDGIQSSFAEDIIPMATAQQIAAHVLTACAKATDDALVLAVRYLGLRQ